MATLGWPVYGYGIWKYTRNATLAIVGSGILMFVMLVLPGLLN
jgi:hypothetical protein